VTVAAPFADWCVSVIVVTCSADFSSCGEMDDNCSDRHLEPNMNSIDDFSVDHLN